MGGNGSDTLRLDGSGLTLDLTAIPDNQIMGIEEIDLVGSGANTLVLDVLEVLHISDTSNTLIVQSNGGDVVDMGGGWTDDGVQDVGGESFHVYTQGAAKLLLALADHAPVIEDATAPLLSENIAAARTSTMSTMPPRATTRTRTGRR